MSDPGTRADVAIAYHMFPHYRAPVLRALAASQRYRFSFWGSLNAVEGIEPFVGDEQVTIRPLKTKVIGGRFHVSGIGRGLFEERPDVLILLGNPNIAQTWTAAIVARAMGKKVLFWAHGWLKPEGRMKAFVRNLYFGLGHGVLVYGDRAKVLAASTGFDPRKVFPIYNSLDWDVAEPLFRALEKSSTSALRQAAGFPQDRPVLICTARLTPLCRFDLLLEAMAILQAKGTATTLILVGDGPERASLEARAEELALDVRFLGALYDEAKLSRLIYLADMTVSPGKVGLTAMHSLTYGTPVVTHSDLDQQMPEVEAVVEGETGAFFERDNEVDLAQAIERMLADPRPRTTIRQRCRQAMVARYTPAAQRTLIENALDTVLDQAR